MNRPDLGIHSRRYTSLSLLLGLLACLLPSGADATALSGTPTDVLAVRPYIPRLGTTDSTYRFGPDAAPDMQRCRVIDANADGYSWHFSAQGPSVVYEGNDNDADDYLFLPPVELTDTGHYRLHFQAMRGREPQVLSVGFATAQSVAGIVNSQLSTLSSQLTADAYATLGTTFHCSKAGIYYPVLHISSKAGSMELRCREFRVEEAQGDVRRLPLTLAPTPGEASEFAVLDADGDGISWRYRPDSADFAVAGPLGARSDDYLLLPPFRAKSGSYALDFDVRSENPSLAEKYEVRYGPDGVDPALWQVVLTHPARKEGWRRERALIKLTDTVPYRAAIRYVGANGDGLHVRRFDIAASEDSLLELPCIITVDSLLQSGDTLILSHAPFRTPRQKGVHVAVHYRGTGPAPATVTLLHSPVDQPDFFEPFFTCYEMLCRGTRSRTATFYAGDDHGQTLLALRLEGDNRDGVVIESIEIDTLRDHDAPDLPTILNSQPSTLNSPTLFGPVWVENQIPALAIDVEADGPYRLLWGRDSTAFGSETSLSSHLSSLSYYAVPQGFGKHYLTVVPLADSVRVGRIEIRETDHPANGPAAPAVRAVPIPSPKSLAQVQIALPKVNMAGMRLWENEGLSVRLTSPVDTVSAYGLPGDTLNVRLRVPQGATPVSATCGNWVGWGPEGCDTVYGGTDAPTRLLSLEALPTADNLGVHLHWQPDTVGRHGAYADPSTISYAIEYTPDGKSWLVADTVTSQLATIPCLSALSSQLSAIRWRVTPFNTYGAGRGTETVSLTGEPLAAPLREQFRPEVRHLFPVAISDSLKLSYEQEGIDPSRPHSRAMLLEETGYLLLPSFTHTTPVQLLLRLRATPGAMADLEILTDGRKSLLLNLTDAPGCIPTSRDSQLTDDEWHTVVVPVPDSLVRAGDAATFRLTLRSGILRIGEYAIVPSRPGALLLDWSSLPAALTVGREYIFRAELVNTGSAPVSLTIPSMSVAIGAKAIDVQPDDAKSTLAIPAAEGRTLTYRFTPRPGFSGTQAEVEIAPDGTGLRLSALLPFSDNAPGTTGLSSLSTQLSALQAVPGGVRILGLSGQRVEVYTADGLRTATLAVPSDDHFLPLSPALYIVRCGGVARKVQAK